MAEVVYLELQSGNGGILVDVSRSGLGFQAACPIHPGEPMRFRFSSESIRRIEVTGDLVWTDRDRKRGGLRFGLLPAEVREQIQLWLGQSGSAVPAATDRAGYTCSRTESSASTADLVPSRQFAEGRSGAILWTRDQSGRRPGRSPDLASAASDAKEPLPDPAPPQVPFPTPRENWRSNPFSDSRFTTARTLSGWNDIPRSRPSFPAVALTAILAIAATIAVLSTFYKQEASATFIRWGQIIAGQRHEQTASIGSAPRGAAPGVEPLQPPSTATPQVETGETLTPTTSPSQNAPARAPEREATDSAIKSVDREAKIPNDQGGGKTELTLAHDYLARASSPKDRDVGMKLLWVAVGNGNTEAEVELASLYLRGEDGSAKNCIQARILLRAAYSNGNQVAGQRLAELPDYGCR